MYIELKITSYIPKKSEFCLNTSYSMPVVPFGTQSSSKFQHYIFFGMILINKKEIESYVTQNVIILHMLETCVAHGLAITVNK